MDKELRDRLDIIVDRLGEVRKDTEVQSVQIGNINEKLGRGRETFEEFRGQFSSINSHLSELNSSMVRKLDCSEKHSELKQQVSKDRRILYVVAAAVLLGGGAAANSPAIIEAIRMFFGGR